MTNKDLNIIDDLLNRVDNLPEILHLRAAKIKYILTEDDKKLLHDTYQNLDEILREVAAFINVKFPGRKDHIHAWNEIDFDTKIGGFKIVTTDREHTKREWRKGMFDLKDLLKSLRSEVVLLIDDDADINRDLKDIRTNNFQGNIVYNEDSNKGNQSLSDNSLESPTIQKITKHKLKKPKRSLIEIIAWITGIIASVIASIIASIIAIYEFWIK
jgi:hypothetical protein